MKGLRLQRREGVGSCLVMSMAGLLLLAFFLSGCLSRPSLVRQNFSFPTPSSSPHSAEGRTLSIRRLSVAPPFEGRSFIYRTGECSFEQDPYAQFLVSPQESLAEPIRGYLRNDSRIGVVTEPGGGVSPDLFLEISVTHLYGDFRDPKAPAAVLSIRFLFFDATAGFPAKLAFEKEYDRRIPVKARTAVAVMDGWNEALKQIMEALRSDERF